MNRGSFCRLGLVWSAFSVFFAGFLADGARAESLESWLSTAVPRATQGLLDNVSPRGTAHGAVIASPSRRDPDYYFHWIRDAALTMDAVVTLYERTTGAEKQRYFRLLTDYAEFSRKNQLTPNMSGALGFGEPKFHVDGSAFEGDWGRPQNDGPAARALTLIRFARKLLDQGQTDYVKEKLYRGVLPADTVIKADLEFIGHHWTVPSFDLWEEVLGQHFYTRMLQRKALIEGAALATLLGDVAAGDWYWNQAQRIEQEILRHWDASRGHFRVTLERQGTENKPNQLDSCILLGVLHASGRSPGEGSFLGVTDDRVLATADRLISVFESIYPINQTVIDGEGQPLAPGIGRYPEDKYNGYATDGEGNPWFLATAALAELHYRAARLFEARGRIEVSPLNAGFMSRITGTPRQVKRGIILSSHPQFRAVIAAIRAEGDKYLRRIQFHTDEVGGLAEQFNRNSGHQQGARDLTWSYASLITATSWR